jgi:hypothetical protein
VAGIPSSEGRCGPQAELQGTISFGVGVGDHEITMGHSVAPWRTSEVILFCLQAIAQRSDSGLTRDRLVSGSKGLAG